MPRKKKVSQAPLLQQIKRAQQAVQQMVQQARQQARQQAVQQAAQQAPRKATKKRAKKGGITDAMKSRAATLTAAIKAGRLAVKQGIDSPTKAQGKTPRARYAKFLQIYKGARPAAASKKAAKPKVKSVRAVYQQIKGQQKFPYYLSAGYTARVGGGASGPGVIRAVPKSGATPFRRLDEDKQKDVVRFLNTEAGKSLRGKGAKRQVTFQKIKQALKTVRSGPGIAKRRQKKSA
jgi:hypothetical protein